jgi:F0F1-type ATP synthase delta subunit
MAPEVLKLPAPVVSSVDVARLSRELEAFEAYIEQARARKPEAKQTPPRTSRLLDELVGTNGLNLLQATDRAKLAAFLKALESAPNVHISFASDPSAAFTEKIVSWFRINIHPNMLVHVGLQPNIAAGCIVRTNNKVFDFSLRQNFAEKQQMLIDAIGGKA